MSLQICRGTPEYSGRYVVYTKGEPLPLTTMVYLVDHGKWLRTPGYETAEIVGWIGPLPLFPKTASEAPVYDL